MATQCLRVQTGEAAVYGAGTYYETMQRIRWTEHLDGSQNV